MEAATKNKVCFFNTVLFAAHLQHLEIYTILVITAIRVYTIPQLI